LPGITAARPPPLQAAKRQIKKESGTTCEHGIWKCRICNPVVKHK
jgi:hypothetical protein